MAAGPTEERKADEGQATLPEVHRRDEADRAKAHHLRTVPVEGGRDGMRRDHLPLDLAGEALLPYKDKIHTITADNGKEFARHKEIAKALDAEFYFARPYHSWERGANENTNGLIRQYIPKGTDFSELTDDMLAEIEWKLNHRPRKTLGYRTPLEYCKQLFNFDF